MPFIVCIRTFREQTKAGMIYRCVTKISFKQTLIIMKLFKKISTLTALFTAIACLSFSTSFAQDTTKVPPPPQPSTYMLKGKVVDAQTAEVVADAEVTVVG